MLGGARQYFPYPVRSNSHIIHAQPRIFSTSLHKQGYDPYYGAAAPAPKPKTPAAVRTGLIDFAFSRSQPDC